MTDIGDVVTVNLIRSEDDTDDVVVHLTKVDGTDADINGWTGILAVGPTNDTATSPQTTFNGAGVAGGLMVFNMATFAVPKGTYKYDIRITDTITGDVPRRVYFKGKMKVTPRIN